MTALAESSPAELRVRLCGSTAKVSLQPDEGFDSLRSRVAGAFGLTVPFDLVGPDGVPLRSDEDAARMAGASLGRDSTSRDELIVDANEDALIDLERSHEEAGALRWALLRKILAGIRTKMAEVLAAIAEGQRRTVALDEQLLRERSSREAGAASLRAEIRQLADNTATELHRVRQEAKSCIEASTSGLVQQLEATTASQHAALSAVVDELKEAQRVEAVARQREADDVLRRFEEIRKVISQESEAREEALKQASGDSLKQLEQQIALEAKGRLAAKASAEEANASLEQKFSKVIEDLSQKHTSSLQSLQQTLEEARKEFQSETSRRGDAISKLQADTQVLVAGVESRLTSQEASFEDRISQLAGIESALRSLVAEETAKREAAAEQQNEMLRDLSTSLLRETAERKAAEDRLTGISSTLQEAAAHEQRSREALASEQGKALGGFATRLEVQEQTFSHGSSSLRSEMEKLDKALSEFVSNEREAREAACRNIVAGETRKHEDFVEEMRRSRSQQAEDSRQWAQALVERLSTDLRGEREALFAELKQHAEELTKSHVQQVRTDVLLEVKRVDAGTADLIRSQQTSLEEERRRYEVQARTAAQEVKAALDAHGEFAEALEREQRLLVERLQESLTLEGEKREGLTRRVHTVEFDVQKVKGHLPILFASPTAFR